MSAADEIDRMRAERDLARADYRRMVQRLERLTRTAREVQAALHRLASVRFRSGEGLRCASEMTASVADLLSALEKIAALLAEPADKQNGGAS